MTLTHLDLDRIEGLAGRLRDGIAVRPMETADGLMPDLGATASMMAEAASDLTALITRIRELEGALTEAREGCQLLEDLCACGSDDDYVTDLLAKIDAALQRKTP